MMESKRLGGEGPSVSPRLTEVSEKQVSTSFGGRCKESCSSLPTAAKVALAMCALAIFLAIAGHPKVGAFLTKDISGLFMTVGALLLIVAVIIASCDENKKRVVEKLPDDSEIDLTTGGDVKNNGIVLENKRHTSKLTSDRADHKGAETIDLSKPAASSATGPVTPATKPASSASDATKPSAPAKAAAAASGTGESSAPAPKPAAPSANGGSGAGASKPASDAGAAPKPAAALSVPAKAPAADGKRQ